MIRLAKKVTRRRYPIKQPPSREGTGHEPSDRPFYKTDHGSIETVKAVKLREAFLKRKTAKVTFEEFENMTSEALRV